MRRPTFIAFCLAIVPLLSGCGSGPRLYPVTGKVTLDGAPVAGAAVTFVPDPAKGNTLKIIATGQSGPDGTFTLKTEGDAGAPAGWYQVSVMTRMSGMMTGSADARAQAINPRFEQAATSGIAVEVVAAPAADAYAIRVTK